MGSPQVKATSRSAFGTPWLLACTLPAVLGYVVGERASSVLVSPFLLVEGVLLGVLQGLLLERLYGVGIFWRWLAVTVPLVIVAPFVGVAVGVVFLWVTIAADALLQLLTHAGPSLSAWGYFIGLVMGFAGAGAPVVVAQWLVVRKQVGRRWLWTFPVPGLTYGLAYMFWRDPHAEAGSINVEGLVVNLALALVYGVITAGVIVTTMPERPATAVEA